MTSGPEEQFRRLSSGEVVWLDPSDDPPARVPGPPGWSAPVDPAAPSPGLWARGDETGARIGIRVTRPIADPVRAAARLLAAAVERQVTAVILSHVDDTGLERFGFRVEAVGADDPALAEVFEAEAAALWGIGLIVDADDLGQLG